jgi:hypothetical protein
MDAFLLPQHWNVPEIEEEWRLLDVAFILLFRSASSPWPETRRAIGTYVGQMGFAKKDHQVCLAHLIRRFAPIGK